MGNAINKNFDISKDHSATAGHQQLWKVYDGVKRGTNEPVSVWTMQKGNAINACMVKYLLSPIYDVCR
jgi:hypothetical protein